MKRIKLSEQEILAVIVNSQRELKVAFEMLPKRPGSPKEGDLLKKAILDDLDLLLTKVYQLNIQENNLYDSVFKLPEKVVRAN